ncbi:MAG TPA: TonB-dependent receptor [Terriglobales bacterium]|nr:TonB-dependent receptor [Terriglobales bacterium]
MFTVNFQPMPADPNRRIVARLLLVSRAAALVVAGIGAFVLVGWVGVVSAAAQSAPAEKEPRDLTELSVEELANVEVSTAGKKPQKRSEVAAAIYVITQEDIRRSGATSIPEALRLAPGVIVARVDSNKWAIGTRGFPSRLSRSLLVLMDGRSVYTPLFAGVYWEVQDTPLEDIERIEVIRGPGGTLWGANAVNGVVNVITREARDTQGMLVSAGAGTVDRGFSSFRYGGRWGENNAYRVYGKFFNRDPGFHAAGNNFDDWRMGQAGFRSDWELNPRDHFTLQGDVYRGESGQRVSFTILSPPSVATVQQNADLSGGNVLGRWRRALGNDSEAALQFYYDRTDRDEPTFREIRDTFDLDFQNRLRLGRHHDLNWGAGYRLSSGEFTGVPTIVFRPARRTDHLFSAFLQDGITLIEDRLTLTVGAKLEHNSYSAWELQPSARVLWKPARRHTLWAAITRAVRTPSRVEHDLESTSLLEPVTPTFSRFLGDRNFVPETLLSQALGYRVQATDQLFLDLTGFYNRYFDLLSIEPGTPFFEATPPPPHLAVPVTVRNGMEGRTWGAEAALDWRATGRWRFKAAYSFLRVNLSRKPGSLDVGTEKSTEGSSPRHQFSLSSFANLTRNIDLDVTLRYVAELVSQGVPQYATADARLGWRPRPPWEIAVVGQNLFAGHHLEFGGGNAGRTEIRRGVYLQLSWRH